MSKQPETLIQERIQKYIKDLGGRTWKVHGSAYQPAGEPDLDGYLDIGDGQHIHMKLEVKTPTGKPSKLQIIRLRQYHKAGYTAGIVTSVEDTEKIIRACRKYISVVLSLSTMTIEDCYEAEGIVDEYKIWSE